MHLSSVGRRRARITVALCGVLAASILGTVHPSESLGQTCGSTDLCVQWEDLQDSGNVGHDFPEHAVTTFAKKVNSDWGLYVAGTATKSATLQSAGIRDRDVFTVAYNQDGSVRWKDTYDNNLSDEELAGMEPNPVNSNLLYLAVNSGNEIRLLKYSMQRGSRSESGPFAGTASDTAVTSAGGVVGIVGRRAGDFLVLGVNPGQENDVKLEATPVPGKANGADILWEVDQRHNIHTGRTMVATGESSGFGTGGDLYTVAYNTATAEKLWEFSWASPDNKKEYGVAAEVDHISALSSNITDPAGDKVFVIGQRYTATSGWDIMVMGHDLSTGQPMWDGGGVRFFDGAGMDDQPVDLEYSDVTQTLYVTGTSDRPFPHGQDIVTIAYDALTGAQKGVIYSSGNISNGDDVATAVKVHKPEESFDAPPVSGAEVVYVSGEVLDLMGDGGRQMAVFAYDSDLNPVGSRRFGTTQDNADDLVPMALDRDNGNVYVSGASQQGSPNGYDFHTAAFAPIILPEDVPEPTDLSFTSGSPADGQYTDTATFLAALTETDGDPVPDQEIEFRLADRTQTATTDAGGVASASFTLDLAPGTYEVSATFAGSEEHEHSSAATAFEVRREDTNLTLVVEGNGANRTLTAHLSDADGSSGPISGRTIAFYSDEGFMGSAVTDENGTAVYSPERDDRASKSYSASFGGDDYFLAGSAGSYI